jgi:hypothetical protein
MLKTSKPAAAFSINMPGDVGVHGARWINRARFPAMMNTARSPQLSRPGHSSKPFSTAASHAI